MSSASPARPASAKPGQLTAMISSTALDLPEHRAAVKEACLAAGFSPIFMEHLPARDASGVQVSLEMVEKADLYLGIYAWRYGWVPDGSDISVTEMEFDRAIERQKAGKLREVLIFTAHEKHPCTIKDVETGDVPQQRLTAFKIKACNGRVRKEFSSVEELRRLVSDALHEFRHRQEAKTEQSKTDSAIPVNNDPPSNLPGGYIGQLFLGREDLLKELRTSLLKQTETDVPSHYPAATAIVGLGGMGKTHVAMRHVEMHRDEYAALLFISGDSPQRIQASLAGLCEEVRGLNLHANLPTDEKERARIALDWLASHHGWLLIVDNVDDEAAALALTAYFDRFRTGHVLITSRLNIWSANVESLILSELRPEDAADLLLKRTDQHRRKAADDALQALALADVMEGLPLALQQAASYIIEKDCTFAEYLSIYRDEEKAIELLGWFNSLSIPYEGPDRQVQRPVIVTWKTSFDQLTDEARRWLLVFSQFAPDPIPAFLLDSSPDADDTVKMSHRAAREALAQARKYCLLTRLDDPPRLKIHRLVQEVTRLNASEEERLDSIDLGILLIWDARPGDPQDVRTWKKWNPLQPHALALCQYAPDEPAPRELAWLLGCLSLLLNTKALYVQAEPLMLRALEIDEAIYGREHPLVASDLNNLAQLLQTTNRLAEAEPLMRRALEIDEATLGPNHPKCAVDLNNLAQLLQSTHRLTEAEPLMRRGLEIEENCKGPCHPHVAIQLNNLAQLLRDTNRLAEAEPLMRRVLQIDEASFGVEHPKFAIALNNLAQLLQATNRLAEAEPLMWQVLEIDQASFGQDHPDVARDLNNLAGLLHVMDRLLEAEPLMRQALSICVRSLGNEHPKSRAVRVNYIAILQDMGLSETEIRQRVQAAMRRE